MHATKKSFFDAMQSFTGHKPLFSILNERKKECSGLLITTA